MYNFKVVYFVSDIVDIDVVLVSKVVKDGGVLNYTQNRPKY